VLQCALGHQWTLTQADEEILLTGGRQAPVHAIRCRACERLARAAAALRWDDPDVLRTPGGAE
jgi:hypothetical protein